MTVYVVHDSLGWPCSEIMVLWKPDLLTSETQCAQLHFPFGIEEIFGLMQQRWKTREQVSQQSRSPPFSHTSQTSLWSSSFFRLIWSSSFFGFTVSLREPVQILDEIRCFSCRGFPSTLQWSLSALTSWLATARSKALETSVMPSNDCLLIVQILRRCYA